MDFAAKHAGFVIAAYAISALVLFGIAAWILVKDRSLQRRLDERDRNRDE
jgi:heme exporter protein CcmD